MTSTDEQLHQLFRTAPTPVDGQGGDIRAVRATVHRRQLRQRASILGVAATFVVLAGVGLVALGGDDQPGATEVGTDGVTTNPPSTSTSLPETTTTSTTTTEPPPPQASIREVDFANRTYPAPCPTLDQGPMTLAGGTGENVVGPGASVQAELGQVAYADADRDGQEDAIVLVNCWWVGADSDSGLLVAVYRPGSDGEPQQVGEALTLEHTDHPSLDGLRLSLERDVYDADDAQCCPSSRVVEVWRFDGTAFLAASSRTLFPPAAGLKPPDGESPAAGTCAEPAEAVVEVVVNPDVPSPRCTRVGADQRLRLRNATEQDITVSLGEFSATLAPGEARLFDGPFGAYLQPGVHRVTVPLYGTSGPEIWLVA